MKSKRELLETLKGTSWSGTLSALYLKETISIRFLDKLSSADELQYWHILGKKGFIGLLIGPADKANKLRPRSLSVRTEPNGTFSGLIRVYKNSQSETGQRNVKVDSIELSEDGSFLTLLAKIFFIPVKYEFERSQTKVLAEFT